MVQVRDNEYLDLCKVQVHWRGGLGLKDISETAQQGGEKEPSGRTYKFLAWASLDRTGTEKEKLG